MKSHIETLKDFFSQGDRGQFEEIKQEQENASSERESQFSDDLKIFVKPPEEEDSLNDEAIAQAQGSTHEEEKLAVYCRKQIVVEEEKEPELDDNLVINEHIREENAQPQIEPGEQAKQDEFSDDSYDEADLEELTANEAIITSIEEANR